MFSHRHTALASLFFMLASAALTVRAQTPLNFPVYAGSPPSAGYEDGPGAGARFAFGYTSFIAGDSSGNSYVSDPYNHTIRKISPTGVVTTFAGLEGSPGSADGTGGFARFNLPTGVAVDGANNLYVVDQGNNTIRKITPAGVVTTIAGTAGQAGSADGVGPAARFSGAQGLAADGLGNLIVADSNNYTIRQVTPAGVVTTIAGSAGFCGNTDGPLGTGLLCYPSAVAVSATGDIYIADDANALIRKLSGGTVSTFAGNTVSSCTNADGGLNTGDLCSPWALTFDLSGNLFVTDELTYNVRRITPAGVISTFVGPNQALCAGGCPHGSVDGVATSARFNGPEGIRFDASGNRLVMTDYANNDVRSITLPVGGVTRIAGTPASVGSADGTGTAMQFYFPRGMVRDANYLYVADTGNNTIRRIDGTGTSITLAGFPGTVGFNDGTGSAARFNFPSSITTDGTGSLFVADRYNRRVRRVNATTGAVTTWAGIALGGAQDGGPGTARFRRPSAVAYDPLSGSVYVADILNSNIRKIDFFQNVSTLAGPNSSLCTQLPPLNPCPSGSSDGVGTAARFRSPNGIAVDAAGNVWVSDTGNHTIRKITPSGMVTTVAGMAGFPGSADGSAAVARFYTPTGLSFDSSGNLLVADTTNQLLRMVSPGGAVTTIAGYARHSGNAGTGLFARFFEPYAVITNAGGNYLVLDTSNHAIRISSATGLNDLATIDATIGSVGALRQLNTNPNNATTWQWKLIRQPSSSTATLSSTTIRNPTFTPDVADHYSYRVTATNGANSATTEVSLRTALAPRIVRDLAHRPALARPGEVVILQIQDLRAPVQLFFSDGVSPTVPATLLAVDIDRGIVMARVPSAGALTGYIRLTSAGTDALPFYYRVVGSVLPVGPDQVSGVVTKLTGGAPIVGAAVVLLSRTNKCNSGGDDLRDATITDAAGNYTLRGDPGAAQIIVFVPFAAGAANGGTNVTLGAAPIVAPIALATGTTVTGSVLDAASGQPLPYATLNFDSNGNGGFEVGFTDSAGNFSFQRTPSVTANDENLEVNAPYKLARTFQKNSYTIGSISPQAFPAITLAQGVVISGTVTRALDGTPMSGADIKAQLTNGGNDVDRSAVLGDGSYLLTVPSNQTYRIDEQTSGTTPFVDQSANSVAVTTLPVTQNFALLEAGFISGNVTDSGTGLPISNLNMQARLASNFNSAGWTSTCSDGTYSIRVAPGAANSVVLSTQNNSCTTCNPPPPPPYANQTYKSGGNTWFYCEGSPLIIASAGTTIPNINFNTPRAATVTGSFYTQASTCTATDPAVNSNNVKIDDGTVHACGLGDTYYGNPPPAGTYAVNGLPPSSFFPGGLRSCYSGGGMYSPQCAYKKLSPAYDPITVVSTGTAVANFCLGNRPTTVVGGLLLGKGGANINFNWNASPDLYHDHYRIYQASTARPSAGSGTFPGDPFSSFFDVFSGTSTSQPGGPATLFYLVVDTGITGTPGPSGSYGN